jgi:thiol-disulfide isomerase/thioredoxin
MKKLFTFAVAALTMLSACASVSMEQKLQDFQEKMKAFEKTYTEGVAALKEDASLAAEDLQAKTGALYEEVVGDMKEFCLKTLKKNRNNELGLEAFKNIQFFLEPDELEKTVASLGDSLKTNPGVQRVIEGLKAKKATQEGKPFTDFTVVQDPENAEASTVKLSDYVGKGKYVLVDFWASWCGPCKAEIPNIRAVYEKYAGEDFDVLSVAVWDKPEDTVRAAEQLGVTWKQIINAQQAPTNLYGIDGIPHIILFGPDGIILKRDLRGEQIESTVATYVKAKK